MKNLKLNSNKILKVHNILIIIVVLFTFSLQTQAQTFTMTNGGNADACSGTFYDPGGTGNYSYTSTTIVYTICSSTPDEYPIVEFTSFDLWSNSCIIRSYDVLNVYDGANTSSPKIASYEKTQGMGQTVTGYSGCLTFEFNMDTGTMFCASNSGAPGWVATISCVQLPDSEETGENCFDALPFCSDQSYNFPNSVDGNAPSGPDYGCLGTQPKPIWYYMKIATSGPMQLDLAEYNNAGVGIDIDFAMWGPFTNLPFGCNSIMSGDLYPLQCSYSPSSTETIGLGLPGGTGSGGSTPPDAQEGEYYILLLTNYEGVAGYVTLEQTDGTGETDCSIVEPCNIDNFTANISACANDLYSIDGTIEVTDAPDAGDLIVEDCNGNQTVVASAPFSASSYNYTLSNLDANGNSCDIEVFFSDEPSCSQTLDYDAPICSVTCNFDLINALIHPCNGSNKFSITGTVEFTNPPTSGQLVIEDCNGNSDTYNAPFTSPQAFTISNIDADGAACNLTATFTADPTCTIDVDYNNIADCSCSADVGTFTITTDGTQSGNSITLCDGQGFNFIANGDYTPPDEINDPSITYDPNVWWYVYSCPPTVGTVPAPLVDINDDPCVIGAYSSADLALINDQTFIAGYPPGTFTDNIVYYVPITIYSEVDGYYTFSTSGVPCYNMGIPIAVQYLPEITTSETSDCQAGTVSVTISGGAPSMNGTNFTASNLTPTSASFTVNSVGDNGTIVVSGLIDGDSYSFDIDDEFGCTVPISGTFVGTEDPSFNYATDVYCQDDTNPIANITGELGGEFSVSPAGLSVNTNTGEIDLSSATGNFTITYTTPDPVCFDNDTYMVTINSVPVITPITDQTACDSYTLPAITGTNLSGNEAYYDAPGGTGTQYNAGDIISTNTTLYIYDETGTTPNCFDEESFDVVINNTPILDVLSDQEECDNYTLPAISGTNLSGNEAYYDAVNGGGTQYHAGEIISTTTTLYIYDETGTTPSCSDELTVTIVINTTPSFTVDHTDPTCGTTDGSITLIGLDPTTSFNVDYNFNGTPVGSQSFTSDGTGIITIPNLGQGNYSNFEVSTASGCSSTVTTNENLAEPNAPAVSAPNDIEICIGDDVTLTATNPNGATISWDNGISDGVAFNPSATGTTTYNVTATDINNCSASDAVDITVNVLPNIDAGSDVSICDGDDVTLTGTGAGTGGNYSWNHSVINGVTFSPNSTETYQVIGEDANGCENTDEVVVTVNQNPSFTVNHDDPTCGNSDGSITLNGLIPSTNFDVDFSLNGSAAGTQSFTSDGTGAITIPNLGQGNYSNFTVETGDGCSTTLTTNEQLVEPNAPTVTAPDDVDICIGASVTLTATNPDGAIISWDNGINDGTVFTPNAEGNTTYTVTATIDNCSSSDHVNVNVHGFPTVDAGADQNICQGKSATLNATGASTYNWGNGLGSGASHTVIPTSTTTYEVTGQNAYGCENTDEVEITVNDNPVPDFEGDELKGCEPHSVNFTNNTGLAGSTCHWDFGDGKTSDLCSNISHTYTSDGSYNVSLTIVSAEGCTSTTTLNDYINVLPKPEAMFSADPMVTGTTNSEIEFTNESIDGNHFTWIFGDGSPMEFSYDATHTYPDSKGGDYVVTLIASNGPDCEDTIRAIIKINEELIFYVPNSFTPDADDYNETFKPVFTSGFDPQTYTLSIYNRWGEIIFESHNTEFGWPGTYGEESSQIVKQGTYVWKIEFKETDKDKRNTYTGHVTLLK